MKINTNHLSTVSETLQQAVLPALDKKIALISIALFALFVAYRVGYYFYQNRNAPIDGEGKRVNLLGLWSEGTFKDGKLHGQGKYQFANLFMLPGGVLEGTFENGWPVKGKITGGMYEVYEGEFQNDKGICLREGKKQGWPERKYLLFGEKIPMPLYEGKFVRDQLVEGTITWHDGKKEEGTFDDYRKLIGQGKRTYPDGRVEEGIFHHGKLT